MTEVSIHDLPRWSPWVARLLGLAPWEQRTRTKEQVQREYNQEKYAALLEYLSSRDGTVTPEELKQVEFHADMAQQTCISIGDRLFLTTLAEARKHYYDAIAEALLPLLKDCRTVVELGAGYGFNLWMLRQRCNGAHGFLGGELSENAIRMAPKIFHKTPGIAVVPFNFYDRQSYEVLERAEPPVLLFTCYGIDNLPRSAVAIEGLLPYRNRIAAVVYLEPSYELHGDDLLGLLRRRYVEVNDYNRDLLSELRSRAGEIRIRKLAADVIGLNPLHPMSVIEWEFAGGHAQ